MPEVCEFLETCGFYNKFKGNVEVVKKSWIGLYCSTMERSEKCKRKIIRKATGVPPPDNMSPTGRLCKDPGEASG